MLSTGQQYIRQAQYLVIVPGALIFATVLAFNLIGDALRDVIDPRLRRSR
jgi:glutathione transport system permease protein